MQVTQCDKCKGIVIDKDLAGTSFSTETDKMNVTATLKEEGDYCPPCAHRMAAEAGRMLWERFKRTAEREET